MVIKKALKGAWKSDTCEIDPGEEGRLPEFFEVPVPAGGLIIGGYNVISGHVQIPQDELDAKFSPILENGVELIMGMNVQLEIDSPPIPSARLLDFHCIVSAVTPVGTLMETLDVGILLDDLLRANVHTLLDAGHPLHSRLQELLSDYIHQSYENGDIPHSILGEDFAVPSTTFSGKTDTVIYDDEADVTHRIITSFPDPVTLQISIPIYLKIYGYPNIVNFPVIGSKYLESPMGIDTRIIINVPFEETAAQYIAKFDEVATANVTTGPIVGTANNSTEAGHYNNNKNQVPLLEDFLRNQIIQKGVQFAVNIGRRTVNFPSVQDIETSIADMFFTELKARKSISLWTPTASNAAFHVNSVDVRIIDNALNIALNNTGAGDTNAITRFIPDPMEFSIAMNEESLNDKIQQAVIDNGFNAFPKRFRQDDHDVDLNSLTVSIVNFAIRIEGTVTVIDAVLGSIDVDASFTTDVGLHWEPDGVLNSSGFQELKHHQISADVDVDEGIAFWIISIILAVVSFGVGGIFIGIISIIVILIVESIVENIGTESLVNGVTGAIDGISAWPPNLSRIGRVTAVFFNPVEISSEGLVISGIFNVLSSCEDVAVVPALTASAYLTNAGQPTVLQALRTHPDALYSWDPGDGTGIQPLKIINHIYELSDIYVAKHGLKVNVAGGGSSRHYSLVRVRNVPPTVNAGIDITVNEGEIITLEALFEDVEYADTHTSIWDFGDNRPLKAGIIEETNVKPKAIGVSRVQYAWCDNGEYFVRVQVMDNNGGIGTDIKKVTVLNVPPIVKSPERIFAYPCSPITLAGDFTDPGWCDTHKAVWRFGDCSFTKMAVVDEINEPPAAKGKAVASHTYKRCGTYYSECTVIDDDGGIGKSHTVVEVIEIKNPNFNDGFTYNPYGKVANSWAPCFAPIEIFNIPGTEKSLPSAPLFGAGEIFFCEKCLVFDGLSSQRIRTGSAGFTGICQSFGTNTDWEYQVSAMYELQGKKALIRLGLDPTGNLDPASPDIDWSEGNAQDQWANVLQRIKAKGNSVTIFLGVINTDSTGIDCCFDCVELTAMQNTKCKEYEKPVPPKNICFDFKDLNPKTELPSKWKIKTLTFITADILPNRLTNIYPPSHIPGLELRKGLIIEFTDPVEKLILEFSYNRYLFLALVFSDSDGRVLLNEKHEMKDGKTVIYTGIKATKSIHVYAKGEGALSKICFR